MSKQNPNKKPFGFGNMNRRFPQTGRRTQGKIARDRFAFEQAMQGNDCQKLRRGGDFVLQQRDFFGDKVGEETIVDVKSFGSKLTEAQEQRRRRLGRDRHSVVKY